MPEHSNPIHFPPGGIVPRVRAMPEQIELSREVHDACVKLLPFGYQYIQDGDGETLRKANLELAKYENLARAIIAQVREEIAASPKCTGP